MKQTSTEKSGNAFDVILCEFLRLRHLAAAVVVRNYISLLFQCLLVLFKKMRYRTNGIIGLKILEMVTDSVIIIIYGGICL